MRLAGLESGDGLGGGAGDFGEELVTVVDAEGGVGGFNGDNATRVGDTGVDALTGDDDAAAAADPSIEPLSAAGRGRWWAGGAVVAEAGQVGASEWVGQAAQQGPVGVEDV